MKLLILTQKVDINDDILGFFHWWIKEFAKHCEKVTVICLWKGEYELPGNVKVLSLEKEKRFSEKRGASKTLFHCYIAKLLRCRRFYQYIWQERKNYDTVFVHMNTEYVVLGGLIWKLFRKKIGLWYAHGHAPRSLKLAEKLADIIFTSTKSGCRIKSEKIKIVGQGIGINQLSIENCKLSINNKIKIITVGRISPIKDYETLIKAVEILYKSKEFPCCRLQADIVGGPAVLEDEKYLEKLEKIVLEKKLEKIISFIGPIPNKNIVQYYNNADLFVNMSMTGSLDKVILEAMACELITLSCNDASRDLLEKYNLFYKNGDYKELAEKIKQIMNMRSEERKRIGKELRQIIVSKHSLDKLVKKIINYYCG